MTVVAIDCDLRSIYAVAAPGLIIADDEPALTGKLIDALGAHDVILFEIAGATDYSDSKAIAHNKRRWTIWNVATAAVLDEALQERHMKKLLVAPSSVWTKGYTREQRHLMAKCTAKNKDLRECQAMLWFYDRDPTVWIPLDEYLEHI